MHPGSGRLLSAAGVTPYRRELLDNACESSRHVESDLINELSSRYCAKSDFRIVLEFGWTKIHVGGGAPPCSSKHTKSPELSAELRSLANICARLADNHRRKIEGGCRSLELFQQNDDGVSEASSQPRQHLRAAGGQPPQKD